MKSIMKLKGKLEQIEYQIEDICFERSLLLRGFNYKEIDKLNKIESHLLHKKSLIESDIETCLMFFKDNEFLKT